MFILGIFGSLMNFRKEGPLLHQTPSLTFEKFHTETRGRRHQSHPLLVTTLFFVLGSFLPTIKGPP